MARLTLRLPDSLHDAMAALAEKEGVSLNHFVVYALTQATAAELAVRQRQQFEAMRTRYPQAQAEAALERLLDERPLGTRASPGGRGARRRRTPAA